jgi:hypothetical protein
MQRRGLWHANKEYMNNKNASDDEFTNSQRKHGNDSQSCISMRSFIIALLFILCCCILFGSDILAAASATTVGQASSTLNDPSNSPMQRQEDLENHAHHDHDLHASIDKVEEHTIVTTSTEFYPHLSPLRELLKTWPTTDLSVSTNTEEKLPRFDFSNENEMKEALDLRMKEVPFKVYNIPDLAQVGELWNDDYLRSQMADHAFKVKESEGNFFMWHDAAKMRKAGNISAAVLAMHTKPSSMPFDSWLKHAHEADETLLSPEKHHYYLETGTTVDNSKGVKVNRNKSIRRGGINNNNRKGMSFIERDLTYFTQPSDANNFFVFDRSKNKGIQCRFGERGISAAAHYDGGRNMVSMIKGKKRYILLPPSECDKLHLFTDRTHFSFRHSPLHMDKINDWPDERSKNALAIESVLEEGEVLYIPSYWFHYIISLEFNIQCNTRSGKAEPKYGWNEIKMCTGQ